MRKARGINLLNDKKEIVLRFRSAEEAASYLGYSAIAIRNLVRMGVASRFVHNKLGFKFYCEYSSRKYIVSQGLNSEEARRFVESKNDIKQRICLMCNREFESNGPWNRRCPSCSNIVQFGFEYQGNFTECKFTKPRRYEHQV